MGKDSGIYVLFVIFAEPTSILMSHNIPKITLDDLQERKSQTVKSIYRDGYLIASHEGLIDKNILDLFNSAVRMTTIFFVLCKEGEIDITYNMQPYVLRRHSLIIGIPDAVVRINAPSEASIDSLLCQKDFLDNLHVNFEQSLTHILLYILQNPILELTDKELEEFLHTYEELECLASAGDDSFYTKEILRSGIRALIFKVCRMIAYRIQENEKAQLDTRKYEYFKQFFTLLATEYKHHRTVQWYADQLHLSTKYFTSIIRQVSGRTTIDWINDRVIYEAKNLLLYSDMNISEIAYQLNFPSTSFFSKYFKHIVGINPTEFRRM